MPIYEYQCEKCGVISEEWQKISEDPLTDCSQCGAKGSLHKLISNTSFVLKGSGWYVTDFKEKKGNAATGGAVADAAKPESGSHATTETKTETKADSSSKTSETKSESGSTRAAATKTT